MNHRLVLAIIAPLALSCGDLLAQSPPPPAAPSAPAAEAEADVAPVPAGEVVAVVACDTYADLKKQIRWIGTLIDQPMLDGFAESFLMPVTNFKGLAGLDVTRPMGLIVTAAGDVPAVHAYLPVKDLAKLLDALQGVTGPVNEANGVRRISPAGGMPLDIVEQDGWAIVGPRGVKPPLADPGAAFGPVVEQFTLGVEAFPSRMPEPMRRQLQAGLDQAVAAAAAQGQAVDPAAVAGMLESVAEAESLLVGMAIDMEREQVALESRGRMVPGSNAAAAFADMAGGAVTVPTPATVDGKPPLLAAHLAMAVPADRRDASLAGLDTIKAAPGSDAGGIMAVALFKEVVAAMIEAGGYDAAVAIDSSDIPADATKPVPAITAGVRVKDGPALEDRIKKLVAAAGETPGLTVKFDAGKAAGANLHVLTLDQMGFPGLAAADDTLEMTLAVAPGYAYVLIGGDVPARLAAVAGGAGKPDPQVKPLADVTVALGSLLRYGALAERLAGSPEAAGLGAAAEFADAEKSTLVQLLARPIERGMTMRLAVDAGTIRVVNARMRPQAGAVVPGAAPGGNAKPGLPAPALAP